MSTRDRWFAIRNVALLGSVLTAVAILAAPAVARLWEWTDGAGRAHKSRTLNEVPEEFRASAIEIQVESLPSPAAPGATGTHQVERAPSRAAGGEATAESAPAENPNTDRDGHDQAWWQSQVVETRRTIHELEAKLEHLKAESRYNAVIRKERDARHELAKVNEDLEKARKRLTEELPRQAAEAGAPAHWLRVK